MRKGYVYILASKRNGTLYTGVTSDLPGRLYEHQNNLTPGFTSKYGAAEDGRSGGAGPNRGGRRIGIDIPAAGPVRRPTSNRGQPRRCRTPR